MSVFPMLKKDKAEKLDKDATQLAKQITDLKKKKGDKKQIAALEKQYATVVKNCSDVFTKDIRIAASGLKKMEAEVEAAVGAGSKRLVAARTGLKNYRAKRDESLLKPCFGLEAELKKLEEKADGLMMDYAVSWNEYRQANFDVPDKAKAEFAKLRTGIIERTILIRTKHQKLVAMASEASSLETAALDAGQDFETDTDNRLVQLKEVLANVQNAIVQNGKKNDPKMIGNALDKFQAWVASPFPDFKQGYTVRKALYKSLTATGQSSNQMLSGLRRTVDNGKKLLTPQDLKDDRIARVVSDLDETFSAFENDVKTNLKALPELAKCMNEADKRMKAKK